MVSIFCRINPVTIFAAQVHNDLLNQNQTTVAYDNNDKKMDSVYSKRIRAGKRRTYFFDVRATRGNDYYLTITESRKRFNEDGYDRHKIFLYKEDFNKFLKGLNEAVDYVKTELMPDFDFDAFNHEFADGEMEGEPETTTVATVAAPEVVSTTTEEAVAAIVETEEPVFAATPEPVNHASRVAEEVDKW